MTLTQKLRDFNIIAYLLISLLAVIGFVMLYSASASPTPWMSRQLLRFAIGSIVLLGVAITPLKFWLRSSYVLYFAALILLLVVHFLGHIGMGAQRWIDFYVFKIQPSEIMKITLVLALARYFHSTVLPEKGQITFLVIPAVLIIVPSYLVLRQPDLGTTLLLIMTGLTIVYLSGIRMWKVWSAMAAAILSIPAVWFLLHDYQRERLLTFIDPERDPFGKGYHIIQSKIALGSGGMWGKGFMLGTQSHLDFLPEKQTDFIFAMYCEEFGFAGACVLLFLYLLLILFCYLAGLQSKSNFGRYVGVAMGSMVFLYMFINIAMVTGLVPVVGEPLPLISYGGTSLITFMFGLGLVFSVDIHRNDPLGRVA